MGTAANSAGNCGESSDIAQNSMKNLGICIEEALRGGGLQDFCTARTDDGDEIICFAGKSGLFTVSGSSGEPFELLKTSGIAPRRLCSCGGFIYFLLRDKLCRVHTDGSDAQALLFSGGGYAIDEYCIDSGKIYIPRSCVSSDSGRNHLAVEIDPEKSGERVLFESRYRLKILHKNGTVAFSIPENSEVRVYSIVRDEIRSFALESGGIFAQAQYMLSGGQIFTFFKAANPGGEAALAMSVLDLQSGTETTRLCESLREIHFRVSFIASGRIFGFLSDAESPGETFGSIELSEFCRLERGFSPDDAVTALNPQSAALIGEHIYFIASDRSVYRKKANSHPERLL